MDTRILPGDGRTHQSLSRPKRKRQLHLETSGKASATRGCRSEDEFTRHTLREQGRNIKTERLDYGSQNHAAQP